MNGQQEGFSSPDEPNIGAEDGQTGQDEAQYGAAEQLEAQNWPTGPEQVQQQNGGGGGSGNGSNAIHVCYAVFYTPFSSPLY